MKKKQTKKMLKKGKELTREGTKKIRGGVGEVLARPDDRRGTEAFVTDAHRVRRHTTA